MIEESLIRLQGELQGHLPSVVGLWNDIGGGRWRPKDEGHLADEVARHLLRDLRGRGVIPNREVQVRRGIAGGAAGLRTDVHVTAMVSPARGNAYDCATVVIEVKGTWHPEVLTAMETQLVGDYLADGARVRHGLYLVGDYTCAPWAIEDRQRRSARLLERHGGRAGLAKTLRDQAARNSRGLRDVRAVILNVTLPAVRSRCSSGRQHKRSNPA